MQKTTMQQYHNHNHHYNEHHHQTRARYNHKYYDVIDNTDLCCMQKCDWQLSWNKC